MTGSANSLKNIFLVTTNYKTMHTPIFILTFLLIGCLFSPLAVMAENVDCSEGLDCIVAIVEDDVVLKSELQKETAAIERKIEIQ